MSRGTRQETLIRSLIEGLCLTLEKHYQGQPRQKPKLQAVNSIMEDLWTFWRVYPITLGRPEACRVQWVIEDFNTQHEGDPAWSCPEVLIALALALGDHLQKKVTSVVKKSVVGQINQKIQALYDTFDRQAAKTELLIKGAEFADQILAREI